MKKSIPYIFFIALGSYFAEVLSFNYPAVLLNPLAPLPYWLLYIFLIHFLMEKKIQSWSIVYLMGVLVGLITEWYFAKVLFFGGNDDVTRTFWFGFPDAAYLSLVYHPFMSFIFPVFIAQKLWMPFCLPENKKIGYLLPIFVILFSSRVQPALLPTMLLSTSVLYAIFLLYTSQNFLNPINLSRKTQIVLWVITLSVYLYWYQYFPLLGRDYVLYPALPELIGLTIFIIVILLSIYSATRNIPSHPIMIYPIKKIKHAYMFLIVWGYLALYFILSSTGLYQYFMIIHVGCYIVSLFLIPVVLFMIGRNYTFLRKYSIGNKES